MSLSQRAIGPLVMAILTLGSEFGVLAQSAPPGKSTARLGVAGGYFGTDIESPDGLYPMLGIGTGYMNNRSETEGVPNSIKVLGSYYTFESRLQIDFGFGLTSQLPIGDAREKTDLINSGTLDLAGRYHIVDRYYVGAEYMSLLNSAETYGATGSATQFLGAGVAKEFSYDHQYLIRILGRALQDTNVSGRSVRVLLVDLQIGQGMAPTRITQENIVESPKELVVEAPPAKAIEVPKKRTSSISLDQLNQRTILFDNQRADLRLKDERYLSRVARVLSLNRNLFDHVEIIGHADRTGGAKLNSRISKLRAERVSSAMAVAGLGKTLSWRGSSEPLVNTLSPLKGAINRRAEIRIVGVRDLARLREVLSEVQ